MVDVADGTGTDATADKTHDPAANDTAKTDLPQQEAAAAPVDIIDLTVDDLEEFETQLMQSKIKSSPNCIRPLAY